MTLSESELVLNAAGSIYHLDLFPKEIATTVITVGDPERVSQVSKYFDSIEIKRSKREFVTHTGVYKGKKISVISTGIGTDNIDIVFNELDALVNIDFTSRQPKKSHTAFQFVRLGTCGVLQPEITVDSFVISKAALGFDGLLFSYESEHIRDLPFEKDFIARFGRNSFVKPYVVQASTNLLKFFESEEYTTGITATQPGFYGPQGRQLRLIPRPENRIQLLSEFDYRGDKIVNLEMETAGIYGMAALLGHHAISISCVLANRAKGTFSLQPEASVDKLIRLALEKLVKIKQ